MCVFLSVLYYCALFLSFLRAGIVATNCVGVVAAGKPFALCDWAETTDKKTRRGRDNHER